MVGILLQKVVTSNVQETSKQNNRAKMTGSHNIGVLINIAKLWTVVQRRKYHLLPF